MGAKLAGGGGKGKGMAPNSEPNVIPFIDIMLVLLIIFMVASPPPTVDIKVDMPPPGPVIVNPSLDKPTFVNLEDDEAGKVTYFVMGNEVPLAQLEDRLTDAVRANNPSKSGDLEKLFLEAKVFVKADQETAYFNVVELMSIIDDSGFKSVSLVAETAADGT
jgi:biopolymer transport protein ExbD